MVCVCLSRGARARARASNYLFDFNMKFNNLVAICLKACSEQKATSLVGRQGASAAAGAARGGADARAA